MGKGWVGAPLIKKPLSNVQKIEASNAREPSGVEFRRKAPVERPGEEAPRSSYVFQCRNSIFNANLRESWGMANDQEWRTRRTVQYIVEGVKVI